VRGGEREKERLGAKYVPPRVNSKIPPILIFFKRELELLFWSKSSIILGLLLVANKNLGALKP